MALATTVVSGRIPLPDDSNPAYALVTFTLTGFDTDGSLVLPEPIEVQADASGIVSVSLWPNVRGLRGTQYALKVKTSVVDRDAEYSLGKITVDEVGPLDLEDLIGLASPAALSGAVILTQAAYNLLAPPDPDTLYFITA